VRQSVVPLNLSRDLDKFNDSPIAGARRFQVSRVRSAPGPAPRRPTRCRTISRPRSSSR
jgi:hypothetical protein